MAAAILSGAVFFYAGFSLSGYSMPKNADQKTLSEETILCLEFAGEGCKE